MSEKDMSEPRVYHTDDGWTITVTERNQPDPARMIDQAIDLLHEWEAKAEQDEQTDLPESPSDNP